jgi:hypothetical protein
MFSVSARSAHRRASYARIAEEQPNFIAGLTAAEAGVPVAGTAGALIRGGVHHGGAC